MKIPTLINSSSKINGELIFTTDVRIDGEVFGKVESDKNVIVGAEGFVKGFLRAKDLVVFGRIEGNIVVSGITVLHENASIFGNLYTKVFEVKDGATITAKVVTYEKLEAIDEAQIFLAEEMIKVEPGRRQIHSFSPVDISFEEPLDFEIEGHIDSNVSNNQSLFDTIPVSSKDVLSQIIEHNNLSENQVTHFEREKIINPIDTPELFSPLDSVTEINDKSFILLSTIDQLSEIQQDEPVEILDLVNSVPDTEQNHLLEFDDSFNENKEMVRFPLPGPVSIAGCLGEPVKEDSQRMRKVKKKTYVSDPTLTPQAARKSKGHNLSGFEELRNLLIPVRFHDINSAEKKNDQEKYITKKTNESDPAKKPKGVENSDFFLNDAIRQLPSDDYSSLFN